MFFGVYRVHVLLLGTMVCVVSAFYCWALWYVSCLRSTESVGHYGICRVHVLLLGTMICVGSAFY